jgi:hypothetical protein
MHISADCAIYQRDKGVTCEHVLHADAEEQPVLIDLLGSEGGYMEGIGHERIGKHRYRSFEPTRIILFNH